LNVEVHTAFRSCREKPSACTEDHWTLSQDRALAVVDVLKDKGVQIFMAPITEHMTPNLKILRGWASQPWETNFELIPGLETLVNNEPELHISLKNRVSSRKLWLLRLILNTNSN